MEIDLTTPALLFSAISLIMLAYTNRFLSYAQLVRTLKEQYMENPSSVKAAQIANLRKRLYLTRAMQVAGISDLFAVRGQHVLCLYPSPSAFGLYLRFGADIADYFAGHIGVRNIYIGEVFGDTSQRYARVEALRDDVPYGEFQFSPVNHGIEQPDSRE